MKGVFRSKEFRGAFQLHEKFREEKPKRAKVIEFNVPKALAIIGTLEAVEYTTTHKGKAVKYRHVFAPGSRPYLAAGPKRNQVFLVGGRYHFTDRGIVDIDAKGKDILDPNHGDDI